MERRRGEGRVKRRRRGGGWRGLRGERRGAPDSVASAMAVLHSKIAVILIEPPPLKLAGPASLT
jgi:hypothetical protein